MSAFTEDMAVKTAWNLTLTQWQAMTDEQRRYCRENVAQALQENQ